MNTVFRITLDTHKVGSQAVIPCFQGDSGITIIARLTENGMPFMIEDGCTASFQALKPDGNYLDNACVIENNTIVYDFLSTVKDGETCQTTAVPGSMDCQFDLIGKNGGIIASPLFKIVVNKRVYDEQEVIDSVSEATALTEMIVDLKSKVDSGYFNGEKGEKGDKGDPGDSGVQMEEVLDSLFPMVESKEKLTSQTGYYQIPSDSAKLEVLCDREGDLYFYTYNPTTYEEPIWRFKEGASSPYLLPDDIADPEGLLKNYWNSENMINIWDAEVFWLKKEEQNDKTAVSPTRLEEILESKKPKIIEDVIAALPNAEEVSV